MKDILFKKEIIAPIIIIIVSIVIYLIIKKVVNRIYKVKIVRKNEKKRDTIRSIILNVIKYFIIIIDLNMILELQGIDTKSILASLGVVSLIAGLALQDLLKDFIVGVSILLEDQYSIGDVVEIGGFRGTIIDFGLRITKIKSYTGEVKIVANRNITELINCSMNNGLSVVEVQVSYETDLSKAKDVLTKICEKFSEEEQCETLFLGVDNLADSGIVLKMTIEANYSKKFELSRKLKEQIKIAFDKNKIDIPYPQVVVHDGKRVQSK